MKKRSILAICLVFVFLTSMLCGCGQPGTKGVSGQTQTAAATSSAKEVTTLTMYCGDTAMKPIDLSRTTIGKKIEELTGVRLDIEYIVGNDEKTKVGIMIASGDFPDLIVPHNEIASFISAQAIIPMNDYIDKFGVNIKKAYGDLLKMMKTPADGNIYSVSPCREGDNADPLYPASGCYLPVEVLRDAGWPKVTTVTQYFDIIRNYLKKNPMYEGKKRIGFTVEMDGWRDYILHISPEYLAGYAQAGWFIVDDNFKTHCSYEMKEWKEYFKLMNGLWNEGILDPEMFSQTYDQYIAKITAGRVIGFFDEYWQFVDAEKNLESRGLTDKVHIPMPVLFDDSNRQGKDGYNGRMTAGSYSSPGVCISRNCKDPEFAFKFIDRMCADDVTKLSQWGIEGENYDMVDGKMVKSDEQMKQEQDDYMSKQGLGGGIVLWEFPHKSFMDQYDDGSGPVGFKFSEQYTQYKDYEKEVLNAYNIKTFNDLFAPPYTSPYGLANDIVATDSEPDIKETEVKAWDLRIEYQSKLIMARPGDFENVWNEYWTKYKSIPGLQEYFDWFQSVIDQRIKDWN